MPLTGAALVDAVLGSGIGGRVTLREMRAATRRRQNPQPKCYREFIDVISALAQNNQDNDAPAVKAASKVMHECIHQNTLNPDFGQPGNAKRALSMRLLKKK
jgi:hypothetical protein